MEKLSEVSGSMNMEFKAGNMYLMRIGKYLSILEILESGCNYMVINIRGLEAQEMTSCHNLEATTIDTMIQ